MTRILVTGAAGLIGRPLVHRLRADGIDVVELDLRASDPASSGDIRHRGRVAQALAGCDGVIHLAAVARVLDAAADPERCQTTNITGTRIVAEEALAAPTCGWLLFASSREVYGQPDRLPVTEEFATAPLNLYGRTKLAAERVVRGAADRGFATAVLRLTNTYGSVDDHPDRVVPAFTAAAVAGAPMRAEGPQNQLDLLHVDDVVEGLLTASARLQSTGRSLPTIHLVSGMPVSITDLARLCSSVAGTDAPVLSVSPRAGHVSRFVGDPSLAQRVLGWTSTVSLSDGVARLVADLRAQRPTSLTRSAS